MVKLRPRQIYVAVIIFQASSWNLKEIQQRWWQIVLSHCPVITINGRCLFAGDGIKIAKEAENARG